MKKTLRHIFSRTVWTLIAIYTIVTVMLHLPVVQEFIGYQVKNALQHKFGTRVEVGSVNLGFLNHITVDEFAIYDHKGVKMLRTARLSAKIDILPLFDNRIVISSAQIFGLNARLYKDNASSPMNIQFVIDSLKSKNTDDSHTPLDLHIASLVIRNGSVTYDRNDVPVKNHKFDVNHLSLSKISSHIMLYALTDDSLNLEVKQLSLQEKCGLSLERLSTKLKIHNSQTNISEFKLCLPHTDISIPFITARIEKKDGDIDIATSESSGKISINQLSFNDLSPLFSFDASALPDIAGSLTYSLSKNSANTSLNISARDKSFRINLKGTASNLSQDIRWNASTISLNATEGLIAKINNITKIPQQVILLGSIGINGKASGIMDNSISAKADISTSRAGNLQLDGSFHDHHITADLITSDLKLDNILPGNKLGIFSGKIDAEADVISTRLDNIQLTADINEMDYNGYRFSNIQSRGTLKGNSLTEDLTLNDPNIHASINGKGSLARGFLDASLQLGVDYMRPQTINLTDKWGDTTIGLTADAAVRASSIDDAVGNLNIHNLTFLGGKKFFDDEEEDNDFAINEIQLSSACSADGRKSIILQSDFADLSLQGEYRISTIPQSIVNLVSTHLPTLPGISKLSKTDNDVALTGTVRNTKILRRLLGININLDSQAEINGFINDRLQQANLSLSIPSIHAYGKNVSNLSLNMWTPNDTLCTIASFDLIGSNDRSVTFHLNTTAYNNQLRSALSWDNNRENRFHGTVNLVSQFFRDAMGNNGARVSIAPSDMIVGDSIWHLRSNDIVYCNNRIEVNDFQLGNENQHLLVNGVASGSQGDSIIADLHNINVEYITDLVNFHPVEFAGAVNGKAVGRCLLTKPEVYADIDVAGFLFQGGRLGDLHCHAFLNNDENQIDIDAFTDDENGKCMDINGYVSPQKNSMDLDIKAERTNLEFLYSWCNAFLDDIDATARGRVRIFGPFKTINIEGEVVADGAATVTSLICRYRLLNDTVRFVPNDIIVKDMPLYDRDGHVAYMTGGLHHQHLSRMTYDFDIKAHNFLAYDFTDFGDQNFYGTAYMSGLCRITGRSSELTIDVNGDVENGSSMTYDASSPDAVAKQEFITWHSSDSRNNTDSVIVAQIPVQEENPDVRTNLRMNFMFNVTPGSTLHLLMDPVTGDYIDLHGSGGLRATYYNKGSFDLYGNYLLNDGTYKMTIQNVIRRDFEFLPGGSISFGGDPYNALLNMRAKYSLNSVSLADLNIGSSFSSNNTKVDCLMNITGTPGAPKVDFDMDLPTINTDAKQMIYSLINSEEEMNQQVLYLLAIGRFYQQPDNNSAAEQPTTDQTSLAMQSIISGTVSQQINNVLGSLIKSSNISLGANIAPGNEGFNNAEYEGLLNGSLLNNRLLFNGQFGYRDNATTNTQGFIGDFDVRYLLFPNGNLAVRVYNQTNDRYFTRNSLNTQGLGLILKKDFNTWRSLFTRRRKTATSTAK